ncbi:hypothetical protein CFP65_2530 [Kitasatospora sp. MMS16-BH015]|uniref:malonate decarboxylase holo-ACP synthase n=1 Tax=Kitasatospora sp. MMS16-BH015 TaxID=2018025 RepID=UPI000CA1E199|nr:malonate decarboxylase holo-ACP synthase [Kitasatospora sp. MMS16-BH015]AUG77359.1 hypothetical protein CFP65_2530 [Kitasatospora sp. MMS16-BH015]
MPTAAPRRRSRREHLTEDQLGRPRRVVGPVTALDTRTPTAHDLLLLHCPDSLRRSVARHEPMPDWTKAVLRGNPWVTVRRAPVLAGGPAGDRPVRCRRDVTAAPESWIPIALRGAEREQRATGYAPRSAVAVALRPEQLPGRLAQLPEERREHIPALAALPKVGEIIGDYRLIWGPIGAVGCELATGAPAVGPTSPLRLLLRSPMPLSRRDALLLRRALRKLPVWVEAELETRHGAVSLAEYSTSPQVITLHTPDGPRVVADPWYATGAA